MESPQINILVIKHGALGDIIQSNGILKNIRQFHKEAKITLLTCNQFLNLMNRCPYIDNVEIDDRLSFFHVYRHFDFFKNLKKQNYSLVYDLQNSFRTSLYRKFFLRSPRWISTNQKKHSVSGLRGLIDMLSENKVPTQNAINPDISWIPTNVTKILKNKRIDGSYIALFPGSSKNHPEKRWPFYDELAKKLIKNDIKVVTILGPDEANLKETCPGYILDNLDWSDLAGIIHSASYVIGNDTGPIHIASCLGKPGFAIFGSTTSAKRSELKRLKFDVLKVDDLRALSALEVYEKIKKDKNFKI